MGSVRAASRQSPEGHFLGCFRRKASVGDPVPRGVKAPLSMEHGPCTGREMPVQPEPTGFAQAGWGIWSFRHCRVCVAAEETTFPPPAGRLTLTTPLQQGLSSRLWELYLGSMKGDFSKRQHNKGSAPQGNRGERVRLMHAH